MSNTFKILSIVLAFPYFVFAQKNQLIFDHLSVDDGLSNNFIYSIIQDSRGFMWIGTEDGLNKYDGYQFTVYRHDPGDSSSISGNWIMSLHESYSHGKPVLWVGTDRHGLNRLDLETEKFVHFQNNPNDSQSLSNDRVVSIYEDSFGELWIGTDRGINKFNRKTGKFIRYTHDPNNPNSLSHNLFCQIYETITEGSPILWVGTFSGLNKFDRKTEKFTRYEHDPHDLNSLSHNLINCLFADSSGLLWITNFQGGLNKFNIETEQFTRYQYDPANSNSISSNMVLSLLGDEWQGNKVLWIATFNGLNKLDLETERFTHYNSNPGDSKSLCDNQLNTIYKDKTGIIWLGTFGSGLNKFDPGGQKFAHIRKETGKSNSLSDNSIFAIKESKYYGPDVFWIATKGGGLNKYDKNSGNFTHYHHDPGNPNSLSSDFVITLSESYHQGRNELWIGTLGGFDKLDLKNKKFTRYHHDPNDAQSISDNIITSICVDKTGILWLGTRNGGLNIFDRNSEKFNRIVFHVGQIETIIEDKMGIVWAGTDPGGLLRFNSPNDDFTQFRHDPDDPNSLSDNRVLSIYEDKSSRLWIGTREGLNLYERETNRFTRYKVVDGLPNNVIYGILEDSYGNLWLSTNQGISEFNPDNKSFRNYDIYDDLQSNQFFRGAYYLSENGEMFFGGTNGLTAFYPERIKENPHIPQIVLTDFQIFNKSVPVKNDSMAKDDNYFLSKHISALSQIELSYNQSVFSIEFAALEYHSPLKNKYAYKMEGVDPDWVYTDATRRFATYTNLDPGEYIFKVKGSNNDGLWNKEGTSFKVIILPPWWRTNWAYSFYVLLILSMVYGGWRFKSNRLKTKQQMEMKDFEAEKLREVDTLKSRFFANISHEFRTPLTLIKGPVKQMLEGEFAGNVKDQYKMILNNSDRLLGLINQILDLSKLESGKIELQVEKTNILHCLNGMMLSFSPLAESKKVTLKFTSTENTLSGYVDCDKLDKIMTNLLSNAFKFTPVDGKIVVHVRKKQPPLSPFSKGEKIRSPLSRGDTGGCNTNSQFPIPNSDFVEISVTNTGPGIPADQLDKIFDRFYQSDDNYKKDSEGSGIGLALTKELIEVCHGEISLSSIPNKTTTFIVKLPIGRESFKEDEIVCTRKTSSHAQDEQARIPTVISVSSIDDRASSIQYPDSGLRSPLLLIVEDNSDVTGYISSFMRNDYRLITAENGKEGLKKALDKYPDLIISDVMMPEMDGFEFCQKVKSDEHISHIPVILLTAKADLDSKIDGLEFGADDYITKPFEARELQIRAKNLIEQRIKLRKKFGRLIEIKPGEATTSSMDEAFLERLLTIFENHLSESDYSTENFAREVGMSRNHLNRKLKALTELSTHEFILNLRLKRAAQLLKKRAGTVSEIAYTVGFNNPSKFARAFKIQYGYSPSAFSAKTKD